MRLKPQDRIFKATSSYPKVYPHITLAYLPAAMENNLEAIRALIPTRDTPLQCGFASVDVGNTYFRSVYIAVCPSVEIMDLHKRVHENLGEEPKTPAFPHLSLVYIADEDATEGERMVHYDLLKQKGIIGEKSTEGEDRVSLNCAYDGEGHGWMDFIDASEVWVVKCEGPVEGWQVLEKFALVTNN